MGRGDTRARFEQWVKNPHCEANLVSAVHGIKMAEVAEYEGLEATMGQSPFAIARGVTFERALFGEKAKLLRVALVKASVLPAESDGFVDFRIRMNYGPLKDLDEARSKTSELLQRIGAADDAGRRALPTIVAGATVWIPGSIMLPDAILVIDVVTIHPASISEPVTIRVGEIKVYPDRGGHTDTAELATARAQGGVYLHALELVVKELGLEHAIRCAREGFLVLTAPGSNRARVRTGEDLRFQAQRAARGFARLAEVAQQKVPAVPEEKRLEAVITASTDYREECVSFCDRVTSCQTKALAEGKPEVLGEDVARFVGPVNLNRVMELLDGNQPATEAEEDLLRRIQEVRG